MLVIKTGKHTYRWLPKWDSQRKDRGKSHTWSSLVTTSNIGPPLCKHGQSVPVENALGRKTSDCLRSKTKIAGDYGCLDVSLLGFRIFLDGSRLQLLIISGSVWHFHVIGWLSHVSALSFFVKWVPVRAHDRWVPSGRRKMKATKASKNIELNNFSIN